MTNAQDQLKRIAELASAYGADPSRWPEADRALMREAALARPDLLAEAQEVDAVLSRASAPPSGASGRKRLLAQIAREASSVNVVDLRRRRRPPRSFAWPVAAALAASLALGVYLGTLDGANAVFSPGIAADDDPVDLAGLGDVSDYLEDQG
ncbi:MAG: hypothetical protein ACJ8AS_01505 [Hyphomicrobiales bacterium]